MNSAVISLSWSNATQFCSWIRYPFPRIAPIPHGTKTILIMHKKSQQNHHLAQSLGGYRMQGLTHLSGRQSKHVWLTVRQLSMEAGWWEAPLALRDLTEVICMIREIALRIKIDSVFDNLIQSDYIFSKNQVFTNSSSPIWTQFPCHSCIFGRWCKHKCNNSIFITTLHIYINIVSTFF